MTDVKKAFDGLACRWGNAVLYFGLIWLTGVGRAQPPHPAAAAPARAGGVDARVETTFPTWTTNRPALAFDGNPDTYFQSRRRPDENDQFTVYFSPALKPRGIDVLTGDTPDEGQLVAGVLEISADGRHFKKAAVFVSGLASAVVGGQQVKALRIRPIAPQENGLVIREIKLTPPVLISRVTQAVAFTMNCAQAPDLEEWGDQARILCQQWYPKILKLLPSPGYEPPLAVRMTMVDRIVGAAAVTMDADIRYSAEYVRNHPGDYGVVIHELTHVVQGYPAALAENRGRRPPVWLVEGIAEYIRLYHYESNPPPHWIDPQSASYRDSYQTTAIFLSWIEVAHTRDFVKKMNAFIRQGQYDDALFKKLSGRSLDALWEEFRAVLPGKY